MPSPAVIKLINVIFRCGNWCFSMFPIYNNSEKLTVNTKSRSFRSKFWVTQGLFIIGITILRLRTQFENAEDSNAVFQMFHVNLLILEIAALAVHLMFQCNTLELCQFFNQLFVKRGGIIKNSGPSICRNKNRYPNRDKLAVLLLLCFVSVNTMFCVIVPLTFYVFPGLTQIYGTSLTMDDKLLFILKTSNIIYLCGMIPIGIAGGQATVIAFVALSEIRGNMKQLQNLAARARCWENASWRYKVCVYYRQMQILVIVSNQCFQRQLWPAVMFCGAFSLISLLYPLLASGPDMSTMLLLGFATFALIIGSVSCMLLDQCTNAVVVSKKIISSARQWRSTGSIKKFLKSCPVIALKVGELHTMDKGRVTAYIRFILQRTAFFVVKYKTDVAFISE